MFYGTKLNIDTPVYTWLDSVACGVCAGVFIYINRVEHVYANVFVTGLCCYVRKEIVAREIFTKGLLILEYH